MTTATRLFTGVFAFLAVAMAFVAEPAAAADPTKAPVPANDSSLNGVTSEKDSFDIKASTPASSGDYSIDSSTPATTGGAGSTSGSSESGLGKSKSKKSEPTDPASVPANDASTGDRVQGSDQGVQ